MFRGSESGYSAGQDVLPSSPLVPDRPPIDAWRKEFADAGTLPPTPDDVRRLANTALHEESRGIWPKWPVNQPVPEPVSGMVSPDVGVKSPELRPLLDQLRAIYASAGFTKVDFVKTSDGLQIETYDYAGQPLGDDIAYLKRRLGDNRFQQVQQLVTKLHYEARAYPTEKAIIQEIGADVEKRPGFFGRLKNRISGAKQAVKEFFQFGVEKAETQLDTIESTTTAAAHERVAMANHTSEHALAISRIEAQFRAVVSEPKRYSLDWWAKERGNAQFFRSLQELQNQLVEAGGDIERRLWVVTELLKDKHNEIQQFRSFHQLAGEYPDPGLLELFQPRQQQLELQAQSLYLDELDLRRKLQHVRQRQTEIDRERTARPVAQNMAVNTSLYTPNFTPNEKALLHDLDAMAKGDDNA